MLAAEQRWWMRNAARIIGDVVRYRYGDTPNLERKVRMLVVALTGIAVESLFDEQVGTAESQRAHLVIQIDLLFGTKVGERDLLSG